MRCRRRERKLDPNTETEKQAAEKRRKLVDREILGRVDWTEAVEPYFCFY